MRLLRFSKTKPEATLRLAYAAGCRMLCENKVQETHDKWEAMQDLADLRWSVIGHLQTNKAWPVARFAAEFHALDSLRVARTLDRHKARGVRWTYSCRSTPQARPANMVWRRRTYPDSTRTTGVFALRVRGLMTCQQVAHALRRTKRAQCAELLLPTAATSHINDKVSTRERKRRQET